jgi:GMP synthase (glutamine-hydrolysing)
VFVTDEGRAHPMMQGKPPVFCGFISHDDQVTALPAGATWLASNDWTRIQALAVKHQKGTFWAVQYHPEYDLADLAALIVVREPKLVKDRFFAGHDDLVAYVGKLRALAADHTRKDLRWQLDIDDDVLDIERRQLEFKNFVDLVVRPRLAGQ